MAPAGELNPQLKMGLSGEVSAHASAARRWNEV
jgi:hypothetical protein